MSPPNSIIFFGRARPIDSFRRPFTINPGPNEKVKAIKIIFLIDQPMYWPFERMLREVRAANIITKYFIDGLTQASIKL